MKKYLPFVVGYSILFNLLIAMSLFLNVYYVLKYDNPFGESVYHKEIKIVEQNLVDNSIFIQKRLDEGNRRIAPILDVKNPDLKKFYYLSAEQLDIAFSNVISKMRNPDIQIDFNVEGAILKEKCRLIMLNYLKFAQREIMITDNEVDQTIVTFSVGINDIFEQMLLLNGKYQSDEMTYSNLAIESDINILTQLRTVLMMDINSTLSRRCCGLYRDFPIVVPQKYYVKVGDPVEIRIGLQSEGSIINYKNMEVTINGKGINPSEPFLVTKHAKKGMHTEVLKWKIMNPITGEIRKRAYEWSYVVE